MIANIIKFHTVGVYESVDIFWHNIIIRQAISFIIFNKIFIGVSELQKKNLNYEGTSLTICFLSSFKLADYVEVIYKKIYSKSMS